MATTGEIPLRIDDDEASAGNPPRARVEDTEMDITPMIDITFLLLIYFIVAANMDQQDEVPLPPARYGVAVAERSALTLTLDADSAGNPLIYLGDGREAATQLAMQDLVEQEKAIAGYAREGFDPARAGPGNVKRQIIIKASGNVKHRDVDRVARAAAEGAREMLPAGLQLNFAVLEESGGKR